jgi:chromate transport protein ChrA
MKPAPSKFAEAVVGAFLPPSCREDVLGDLYERYTGPLGYAIDAVRTVPLVIASRIRRTGDPEVVLIEALVMYLSYLAAAWYMDSAFLADDRGLMRLAIPAAITLIALVLWNAFSNAANHSRRRPMLCAALGTAIALLSQAAPPLILVFGGITSAVLLSSVQIMFPPVTKRRQNAGGPTFGRERSGGPPPISPRSFAVAALLWVIYQFRKRK